MNHAIRLIKQFEGLSLDAYLDGGGVWTIGWGHTQEVKPGMEITRKQAEDFLDKDLKLHQLAVESYVKIPMEKRELEALTSFCFNIGRNAFRTSTLVEILNNANTYADHIRAAAEMSRWIFDNGNLVYGLLRRRQAEQRLFLFGRF